MRFQLPVLRGLGFLALLGLAFPASRMEADTFTVGNDGACTHATLELAVAAALANGTGSDDIRIGLAAHTLGNRIDVNNHSVRIFGGFSSCSASTASGRTTLNRNGPNEAFWVHGGTSPRTFELHDVNVVMGASAGRAMLLGGQVTATVASSEISSGQAGDGGNVYMSGAGVTLQLTHSEIKDGSATGIPTGTGFGGGIYCELGGTIGIASGSSVHGNAAKISGGGIYAEDCTVTVSTGGPMTDTPPFQGGVYANTTQLGGGAGIYAAAGATLFLLGSSTGDLAYVTLNQSTPGGAGGGIYLIGAGTTATARNAVIADNSAALYGGGVYVGSGALFTMDVDPQSCPPGRRCSELSGNSGAGYGGGISVATGGSAKLLQTRIHGNYSRGGLPGAATSTSGEGSNLLVEGCELYDNRPPAGSGATQTSRIYVATTATATFAFSTLFETTLAPGVALLEIQPGSTFKLLSSIVQASKTFQAPAVANRIDCVITEESGTFPGNPSHLAVITDPATLFQNYAAWDFRLNATSEARDFCNTQYYTPTDLDMDNQPRGLDDETFADFMGPYDLGADEALPQTFSDGFESGTTNRWSATAP